MASPTDADREDESSLSSDEDRDGRFHGPDNSWRFYTREERNLATSLDHIENNDLSAHLYNAHRLKRDLYSDSLTSRPWQSKQTWFAQDETDRIPFHPDRAWTAWPLEPADVPRSGEQWGSSVTDEENDAATYRRSEVWKPSLDLQDCLQAEILRQAKDRFHRRNHSEEQYTSIPRDRKPGRRSSSVASDDCSDASSSRSVSDTQRQESPEYSSPKTGATPCFTADEDFAAMLLRPAASHIMSKLDEVLLGLHHSRRGHYRHRSRSRTGSPASRATSRVARKCTSAASSPVLQTHSPHSVPQVQDASKPDTSVTQSNRRASSRDHPRRQELGARDWSEVLGIAALVGWDESVISRATSRCAALFDETMTFRKMPETSAGKAAGKGSQVSHGPSTVVSTEQIHRDELSSHEALDGHYCPHDSCARHREPYPQMWRLTEHLKRKHKHTAVEIREMVGSGVLSTATSKLASTLVDSEFQDGEELQEGGLSPGAGDEYEEYLQPILVNIVRSKDRNARRTPSREHLRKANVLQPQSTGSEDNTISGCLRK